MDEAREEKKKEAIVVKSNALINARYAFSLPEQRLFLKMVSMVRNDSEEMGPFTIRVKDFLDEIGRKGKSEYQAISDACDGIMMKRLHIHNEETRGWRKYPLMAKAEYIPGQGSVVVEFHRDLHQHFLSLKKNFTRYALKFALGLRSAYSIRIYELLKQAEYIGHRYIKLSELREMIGVLKKFPAYGNLKARVLNPAQAEVSEKTDIRFTFTERKEGRKVCGIEFRIMTKVVDAVADTPQEDLFDQGIKAQGAAGLERLRQELGSKQTEDLVKEHGEAYVLANIAYAGSNFKPGKGAWGAFARAAIQGDYAKHDEMMERKMRLAKITEEKRHEAMRKLSRGEMLGQNEYNILPEELREDLVIDEEHYAEHREWMYRRADLETESALQENLDLRSVIARHTAKSKAA